MSTRAKLLALVLALVGAVLSVPSAVGVGGHHADKASRQSFIFLSNDPSQNAQDIAIANGPIHARGVDNVTGKLTDDLVFPKGTVSIIHHRVGKQFGHVDKKTCYGQFGEHGTWKVTGGTGAYANASGGGTYRFVGSIVQCKKQQPVFFTFRVDASGKLGL